MSWLIGQFRIDPFDVKRDAFGRCIEFKANIDFVKPYYSMPTRYKIDFCHIERLPRDEDNRHNVMIAQTIALKKLYDGGDWMNTELMEYPLMTEQSDGVHKVLWLVRRDNVFDLVINTKHSHYKTPTKRWLFKSLEKEEVEAIADGLKYMTREEKL